MYVDDVTRLRHTLDAARDVQLGIVWDAITADLPPPIASLEEILSHEPPPDAGD